MDTRIAFDSERYLAEQSAAIIERMQRFNNKLYLEFGGKLVHDRHAARVLPGFDPNGKIKLLRKLRDKTEILLCIHAGDIERKKMRADFGITYDCDALKLIDDLREWDLDVKAVVMTRFVEGQQGALAFKNKLERRGVRVVTHRHTQGYPSNVDLIVSDAGYGANPYIETEKPLVAVIGPGPNSGKMATCMSQLYHDYRRGLKSGFAKFETFPIWNLPVAHPVNAAYEAATADIRDVNMIDPFHMLATQQMAVSYNRDIEAFPMLRCILGRITGVETYRSPTDMGVNRAGFAIVDDAVARQAAEQEIIRRYFLYSCEYAMGISDSESVERVEMLMKQHSIKPSDRRVVEPAARAAREAAQTGKGHKGVYCGAALEFRDGRIVTGKNSPLFHAASSAVLNAVKILAEIPDRLHLLPPAVMKSIAALKGDLLKIKSTSLDVEEMLIALSISATVNPAAQMAIEKLRSLSDCEIHLTHIPSSGDAEGLRRLGMHLTSDPNYPTKDLFVA